MKIDGACHCGNISYRAEIDPDKVRICHCTDCQALSGTAFRTVVPTPEQDFVLLTGTPKTYIKTAESGEQRAQVFCPECGAHIYATSVGPGAKVMGLRIGCIRQRTELTPKKQYWTRSALAWVNDLASLPGVEGQ